MKPNLLPCKHRHTEVIVSSDGTTRRRCLRCRKELPVDPPS